MSALTVVDRARRAEQPCDPYARRVLFAAIVSSRDTLRGLIAGYDPGEIAYLRAAFLGRFADVIRDLRIGLIKAECKGVQ
jgi:hypothetical protein